MSIPGEGLCVDCVGVEKRVTERFAREDDLLRRMLDMTGKGMNFNSCSCGGTFMICYRGLRAGANILPRYEGELIAAP
jgi:hypothetical protein